MQEKDQTLAGIEQDRQYRASRVFGRALEAQIKLEPALRQYLEIFQRVGLIVPLERWA